jgi:NifU-like protein involved in Fe-S cluster formation
VTPDPYSDDVRRLFAAPAHAGVLEGGTTILENAQGVRVELSADTRDGQLGALRFRAYGCPHLLAAAEVFCADFEGRAVGDLEVFSSAQIKETLDIPKHKTGRILVLEDAVRSLHRALVDAN